MKQSIALIPSIILTSILAAQVGIGGVFYWRQRRHRLLKHQAHAVMFISMICFLISFALQIITTEATRIVSYVIRAIAWCAIVAIFLHHHFLFEATQLRAEMQETLATIDELSQESQQKLETTQENLRIAHKRQTQQASLVIFAFLSVPTVIIASTILGIYSMYQASNTAAAIILSGLLVSGNIFTIWLIIRSIKSQFYIMGQLCTFLLCASISTGVLIFRTVQSDRDHAVAIDLIDGFVLNFMALIMIVLPTILSFQPSFFELDAGHLTSVAEVLRISSALSSVVVVTNDRKSRRHSYISSSTVGNDPSLSLNLQKDEPLANAIPYLNELGQSYGITEVDSTTSKRASLIIGGFKTAPMCPSVVPAADAGTEKDKRGIHREPSVSLHTTQDRVRKSLSFFGMPYAGPFQTNPHTSRPSFAPSFSSDIFSNPFQNTNGTGQSAPKQSLPTLLNASSLLQELEDGLRSSIWRRGFTRFLAQEFCVETLLFLKSGHVFQQHSKSYSVEKTKRLAQYILSEFIIDSAPNQVNLPATIRRDLETAIQDAVSANEKISSSAFDPAMLHVKQTLALNQVPRFKKSAWYKKFILADASVTVPDFV